MSFGVVADRVAVRGDFFGESGERADVLANQEECSLGVVAVEEVEELRRDPGIGAVVEGDGDRGGIVEAAERGAEELR